MAIEELTEEQKIEIGVREAQKELESLTDQQLSLKALSLLVIKLLPETTYNYTMANVLRKRSEGKTKEKIWR